MKSKSKPKRVDEVVYVAVYSGYGDFTMFRSTSCYRQSVRDWIKANPMQSGKYRIARCRLVETKPKRKTK